MLRIAGCAAAAASLGLTGSAGLARAAKKRVLPEGTDLNSLIYSDPKHLDVRNLELMPLEEFGTMGDTGIEIERQRWKLEVTGNVGHKLELAYRDLLEMPAVERKVLLVCPGVFVNFFFCTFPVLRGKLRKLSSGSRPACGAPG